MLKSHLCGVDTGHRRGFVHRTNSSPYYLLLSFKTPFFCLINGKRLEGNAGDCLLQRPGSVVIHGPLSSDEQFVNDWIYFSDDGDGTIDALDLPYDKILSTGEAALFKEQIASIMEESVRRDAYSPLLISAAIYRILAVIKRTAQETGCEEITLFSRFKEARIHILNHYGESWTLQKMADLLGYSVSRFCSLYTDFFGKSPMNDLLDERLEIAKRLLALRVYKIGDVATMCGFSSIHYFSGFFKKRTGHSPSEY